MQVSKIEELNMNEIKQVNGGQWYTRAMIGAASLYMRASSANGGWMYNDGNHRTSSKL